MKTRRFFTTCKALALALALFGAGGVLPAAHAQPADPSADQPAPPSAHASDRAEARASAGADRAELRSGRNDRRGRSNPPLTEDQVEEAVALMIELDPGMAAKIQELRAQRPELLRRALTRRFPRIGYMLKLKESRPALYELRVRDIRLKTQSHQQARALAALPAGDPAADAARARLRDTLERHFAVRQDVRRAEIEILREQLAAMEAKRLDEQSRRDELVGQRLAQLEAQPPSEASDAARLGGRRDDNRRDRERRGQDAQDGRGDQDAQDGPNDQ